MPGPSTPPTPPPSPADALRRRVHASVLRGVMNAYDEPGNHPPSEQATETAAFVCAELDELLSQLLDGTDLIVTEDDPDDVLDDTAGQGAERGHEATSASASPSSDRGDRGNGGDVDGHRWLEQALDAAAVDGPGYRSCSAPSAARRADLDAPGADEAGTEGVVLDFVRARTQATRLSP